MALYRFIIIIIIFYTPDSKEDPGG